MERIGIIGLGLLGSALARRLLASGQFEVLGFDLNPSKGDGLLAAGGQPVETAASIFDACDLVLLSLPTSTIVRHLLHSSQVRPGTLVIDTTTGDPEEMEALGSMMNDRGAAYCDATIAGSSAEAERGDVVIMAGGDAATVARAQPVLDALSPSVFHVGPCGSGSRMKLVVNLVLGLNRAVLAEGLSFAAASGLDPARALEILKCGPAQSKVMTTKGPKMLARDFAPVARLAQHLKDVRLILEQGQRTGAPLPFSTLHAQLLESVVEQSFGEEDNSAILRAFDV